MTGANGRVVTAVKNAMKTALVLTFVGLSAEVSAATFYPSGSYVAASSSSSESSVKANDLGDFDHAYYYTWVIGNLAKVGSVTSAYIEFRSMYNYSNTLAAGANILHLDLLDSANAVGTQLQSCVTAGCNGGAGTSRVYQNQDGVPGDATLTVDKMMNDAYRPYDPLPVGSGPVATEAVTDGVINSNTAVTHLDDRAFVAKDTNYTNTTALTNSFKNVSSSYFTDSLLGTATTPPAPTGNWYNDSTQGSLYSTGGWQISASPTNGGYTYQYYFSTAELTALKTYINNDQTIALGFDPDCHIYQDGTSFNFVSTPYTNPAVPEPATLVLLGTGMIVASRYRRKRPE